MKHLHMKHLHHHKHTNNHPNRFFPNHCAQPLRATAETLQQNINFGDLQNLLFKYHYNVNGYIDESLITTFLPLSSSRLKFTFYEEEQKKKNGLDFSITYSPTGEPSKVMHFKALYIEITEETPLVHFDSAICRGVSREISRIKKLRETPGNLIILFFKRKNRLCCGLLDPHHVYFDRLIFYLENKEILSGSSDHSFPDEKERKSLAQQDFEEFRFDNFGIMVWPLIPYL